MSKKIAVIGGDMRQITMGENLEKDGYDVIIYGFNEENVWKNAKYTNDIDEALKDRNIVILGLPASIDNNTVNTPCWNSKLYIDDLLEHLNSTILLTGGRISEELLSKFSSCNINCIDYFKREDLNILNGIPTGVSKGGQKNLHPFQFSKKKICYHAPLQPLYPIPLYILHPKIHQAPKCCQPPYL